MSQPSKPIKSFKDTKAATTIEPDRFPLEAGINFIVDDFILDNKNSYKQDIAKINGRTISARESDGSPIPGEKVKYWTFGKVIIEKLKALQFGKELPCEVTVIQKPAKQGNREYLDFDSGLGE